MAQLALPAPSQGGDITVAEFEVLEANPFDKFMSVMTDIRDSMGSIEDGFDAMIGGATPSTPPVTNTPNEDDEPGGNDEKPVVPDKSFFQKMFEPMQNAIDGVSKAIMDSGGSDIQKGFKDLGFSSNEGFKLMEDAVDKLKGVGNILKGTGKLLISPFKAMSNSLFGASEDQEESNDAQEENEEAIRNHTDAVDESAEALGKTRDKEEKGRKGILGGFNKFTLMIIAIVATIMAIVAAFKAEAFAAVGKIGQIVLQELDNFVSKMGSWIDEGAKKMSQFFDDAIRAIGKFIPGLKAVKPPTTKPPTDPKAKTNTTKTNFKNPNPATANLKPEQPTTKPDAPKSQKAVQNVVNQADDVAKGAAKTGNFFSRAGNFLGGAAKGLVKRLPLVGALVEGGIDANDNAKRIAAFREAYENEVPIIDNGEGGKRPITPEEMESLEQQYQDSIAGSAGKAGGSLAGASAGAAAGALAGSVVPVIGTFVGGLAGAVFGSIYGGQAGDDLATSASASLTGTNDVGIDFDTLDVTLKAPSSEAIQAAQDGLDGENASADGSISQANATVINNNSYQGAAPVTNQAPINDMGLNASLAT